jgi:hypothetical protein
LIGETRNDIVYLDVEPKFRATRFGGHTGVSFLRALIEIPSMRDLDEFWWREV